MFSLAKFGPIKDMTIYVFPIGEDYMNDVMTEKLLEAGYNARGIKLPEKLLTDLTLLHKNDLEGREKIGKGIIILHSRDDSTVRKTRTWCRINGISFRAIKMFPSINDIKRNEFYLNLLNILIDSFTEE